MTDVLNLRTAPVVGQHRKMKSLVGFDPLLDATDDVKNPSNSSTTRSRARTLDLCPSGVRTPSVVVDSRQPPQSPLPAGKNIQGEGVPVTPQGLARELRDLASEIEKTSLTPPLMNAPSSSSSHRSSFVLGSSTIANKIYLPWKKKSAPGSTSKLAQSPVSDDGAVNFLGISEFSALPAKLAIPNEVNGTNGVSGGGGGGHRQNASLNSPMMQELWYSSGAAPMNSLQIPSLAKPRPTSFLTGKEVVHTSETEATDWQLSIPNKNDFEVSAKVSQFLGTYHSEECSLDLGSLVGFSHLDLSEFARGDPSAVDDMIATIHRPIVEALLECGQDIVQVRGHFMSGDEHDNPNNRREFLILERQQQILCVYRGTKAEQQGKFSKQPETVQLKENSGVEVFADRLAALAELEQPAFALLDQVTDENPFCDVAFAGHGFGAALATLAAYRYASARPELRVKALVTGSPKVGLDSFRMSAHSLPNLKAMRVELGNTRAHSIHETAGCHIGHTIRIGSSAISPKNNSEASLSPIKAYKFSDCNNEDFAVRSLFKRERLLSDYVCALEGLPDTAWVHDYYRQDGAGVRSGKDNEERQMV